MSFITDRSLLKDYNLKVHQKGDSETNTNQNSILTILTFSAILKLHKYKTNISVKKTSSVDFHLSSGP